MTTLTWEGKKLVVRDPIRREMADLMAQIPQTHRGKVSQLLDLAKSHQAHTEPSQRARP